MQFRELKNYKYQLTEDFSKQTNILPSTEIKTEFIDFDLRGVITIRKGYAWDGCSVPFVGGNRDACLVHDAFFQLMREGHLSTIYFDLVNLEFRKDLIASGMSKFRSWYYYKAVSTLGKKYACK